MKIQFHIAWLIIASTLHSAEYIKWDQDDLFFEVPTGRQKVSFSFPFTIEQSIRIVRFREATKSCSCTEFKMPDGDLKPGAKGNVEGMVEVAGLQDVANVSIVLLGDVITDKDIDKTRHSCLASRLITDLKNS